MNFSEVLSKVHMGGINEVCVIEKDGSIAIADETNAVFTYVKPGPRVVSAFTKLKTRPYVEHPLGIRDLGQFMKYLAFGTAEITKDAIRFKSKVGKAVFKLADVESIPRVEGPEAIVKELSKSLALKANVTRKALDNFKAVFDLVRPEVITLSLVSLKGSGQALKCSLGEEISNTGSVLLSRDLSGKLKSCKIDFRASFFNSILAATAETDLVFRIGVDDLPLMIEEKLTGCETIWFLEPYEYATS